MSGSGTIAAAGAFCLVSALAGCGAAGSVAGSGTPSPVPATTGAPTPSLHHSPPAPPPLASPATSAPPRPLRHVYPVQHCSSTYSTSHHDYPASDIFTQKGCAFVAVTSGTVDEVSFTDRWDPQVDGGATRGGRSISIVGDDGVRYYGSHLLKIAPGIRPGTRVRAGQLLGLIDNSGDARYTPTHVHFGISWPTRHGLWWVRRGEVWPQRFLAAWRAGGNLSPAAAVRATERHMGREPACRVEC